ncbi:hypothetical protein [Chryseobacterium vrystaatense]|uniref:Uncharacterized protein n=1 Tax=Chryseobacterium vrystaatense TaxID=307480 RepID=A0ABR4UKD1_9FLAO|nr:hypothetical protein [Chryseobacterium vrystaatense]KFF25294.1 hypothetical protein IW16_14860 [Chryseobacterium vrystaatense]
MKKSIVTIFFLLVVIFVLSMMVFPYISNFVGWNGYQVWKNRSKTESIKESKRRKVFVRELNYKIIDSGDSKGFYFKPYLERGYKVSNKSINDTRIIKDTRYPYNISFDRNLKNGIAIYYKKEDEKKLDSFDGYWGYLKQPYIKDTLHLKIDGENNYHGIIKIW